MFWKKVQNECRKQPTNGDYPDWKEGIAKDCHKRCVYCAIPDWRYGGLDNFHIEHYRPKSKFSSLRKKITNLYLACAICNRFKSNDWPNEPSDCCSKASYPDPGKHDYNELIEVDSETYIVKGKSVAAEYIIQRLYLNRQQLIRARKISDLERRLNEVIDAVEKIHDELSKIEGQNTKDFFEKLSKQIINVQKVHREVRETSQYKLAEIRRQD